MYIVSDRADVLAAGGTLPLFLGLLEQCRILHRLDGGQCQHFSGLDTAGAADVAACLCGDLPGVAGGAQCPGGYIKLGGGGAVAYIAYIGGTGGDVVGRVIGKDILYQNLVFL